MKVNILINPFICIHIHIFISNVTIIIIQSIYIYIKKKKHIFISKVTIIIIQSIYIY